MQILKILVIAVLFPFCLLLTGFITPTPHPPTNGLSEKKQPLKIQISLKSNSELRTQLNRTIPSSIHHVQVCSEIAGRSLSLEVKNTTRPKVRNIDKKETDTNEKHLKKISLFAKNGFYSFHGEELLKVTKRDLFRLELNECLKDFTGVVQLHLPFSKSILVPGKCLKQDCNSNELLWMSENGENKMANMKLESMACQTNLSPVSDSREFDLVLDSLKKDYMGSENLLKHFKSTSSTMGLKARKKLIDDQCQDSRLTPGQDPNTKSVARILEYSKN